MPSARGHPEEISVAPPRKVRRRRERRLVVLFVLAALPVAAVLWAVLNPAAAVGYVIVQTAFLWFGVRRRREAILRLSPDRISYEPGTFVVRCRWSDVAALREVDLPSGVEEALVLQEGMLHWAADARTRRIVEARGWDRVIPLQTFEEDWRWGQIGAAIDTWAPWLHDLHGDDHPDSS